MDAPLYRGLPGRHGAPERGRARRGPAAHHQYWQAGGLPSDDRQLARIACMGASEWKRARPVVAAFFAGGWKHKRMDAELSHAEDVIGKRRAAAHAKHMQMQVHLHVQMMVIRAFHNHHHHHNHQGILHHPPSVG
ncbi:DUF1376 domain-containing protein [Xanthobacter oligotrophicus]|uniref:DUF1376 domain-containing protein n=1 Tax=Xanthobacter oligotrophicus TaxID=2607286 RepID=A0ABW6ZZG7_9HYPH